MGYVLRHLKPLMVMAGCVVLTACTGSTESAENDLYEAEFERARQGANSFQLEILKDGVITDAEYLEAQDRYVACLSERGYTVRADGIGKGYTADFDPGNEAAQQAELECAQETILAIEPLYFQMRDNPLKEDMADVFAECFVREEVAPAGFTGEDYEELLGLIDPPSTTDNNESEPQEESEPGTIQWMGEDEEFGPSLDDIVIPGGKSLGSPEAAECLANPQGL